MNPVTANYCELHDAYERWNKERWECQHQKNEELTLLVRTLSNEIVGIKIFMAKLSICLTLAMGVIQVLAPIILKHLGVK